MKINSKNNIFLFGFSLKSVHGCDTSACRVGKFCKVKIVDNFNKFAAKFDCTQKIDQFTCFGSDNFALSGKVKQPTSTTIFNQSRFNDF